MPLLEIKSPKHLDRILVMQHMMSRKAKNALLAINQDPILFGSRAKQRKAAVLRTEKEARLLSNWAKQPTITESELIPHSRRGQVWGATFGVTVIVQACILAEVERKRPEFHNVLRPMFLLLLNELNNPTHRYLIEPLINGLDFKNLKINNKELKGTERQKFVRQLVTQIAQAFLILMKQYDLVTVKTQRWQLTPLGRRVFLHLVDANKFVETVVEAHQRLRKVIENKVSTA